MNFLSIRRQTLLRNVRQKDGPDAVLITCPVNVTYLTGFTGEASYFVATTKSAVLVTDQRFEAQAKEECPEVDKPARELELHVRPHNKTTLEAAIEVLTKGGAKAVAVEGSRITVAELEALRALAPKLEFVPRNDLVEAQRVIKDPGEVERIREAVQVAERAYRMFLATLREADTEKEMVDTLDGYIRRAGAKGSAFPPIVAIGDRGALPHATPTNRVLADQSKLLIDFGADLGYKSDITRTIRNPFAVAPTRRNKTERSRYSFEEVYEIVLAAQAAALAAIRPGVPVKEVDAAARKVIAGAKLKGDGSIKLGDHFTHGVGHGLGLEIHEAPRVRANSEDILEAGMVITIEPAVYLPGWGGVRIEDDVLVARDGYRLLSSLPRELPPGEE
jgi:Xaa-Pro aminopeptidase